MNKRIDFTQLEGIAVYQDTLAFLQDSFRGALGAVASAFGPYVIVTGVADQGATWGDGWIAIQGELMPFAGGQKANEVIVEELQDTEVFSDDSVKTVYFTKRAKTGSVGGVPMATFVRLSSFASIYTSLNNLIAKVDSLATVPSGLIATWRGTAASIPAGWALCDGNNGTLDLRGKFQVGYNPSDSDYNVPGKTGGAKSVALITAQMPDHFHTVGTRDSEVGYSSGANKEFVADYNYSGSGSGGTVRTSSQGSGQAHENRPPYYTLCFMQKL